MGNDLAARVRAAIRDIPDFPQPGILFRDISTLLLHPELLPDLLEALWQPFAGHSVTHIAALEARGFIFGSGLAIAHQLPLVLMRKPGKLPAESLREEYQLEYGTASLEVHTDALKEGDRVLIVDDLLATGGTALAAARLVVRCGATLAGFAFVAELDFLDGRERLAPTPVVSIVRYGES